MKNVIRHLKNTISTLKEHEKTLERTTPSIHGVEEHEALVMMLLSGWNTTPSGLYYPRS